MGVTECLPSPVLVCNAGIVTITPDPHTKFKTYRNCGLILGLDMPACHQGHLVYLVVVSSASLSPKTVRVRAANCYLLCSATLLFLHAFQLFLPSCDYWCSCSVSFLSLENVVSPLLSWIVSLMESN
jgi:hypothetical protein